MKKIVPIVLFCLCTVLSCTTHTYTPDFLTDDTIRLEVGKKRMFTYTLVNANTPITSTDTSFALIRTICPTISSSA